MRKLKPGKNNKEERMNFVEYWAEFVKKNKEEVWSRQQNKLINSQLDSARKFKKVFS